MSAIIIDGRAVAASIREEVAQDVRALISEGGAPPSLHVVLVGDNPASETYIRGKQRAAGSTGVAFTLHRLPAVTETAAVLALVIGLSAAPDVDAILVQLPMPPHIDADAVLMSVDPAKDADGFHPINFGRLAEGGHASSIPCTPAGCMELLRRYDVPLVGSRAVVLGRSAIVGRPMALLLTNADATVTVCHSKTKSLADVCREADILVVAIGRAGMVDATYVKPGACVIDVGINAVDGGLIGDVARDSVEPVAGWLTPVPGGVGPMTIAMLLRNTLARAMARRAGVPAPW